jgi:hypothetical protein
MKKYLFHFGIKETLKVKMTIDFVDIIDFNDLLDLYAKTNFTFLYGFQIFENKELSNAAIERFIDIFYKRTHEMM